ncbi:MAG: PD40 domain-containing protein [Verrucomicrobiales bacterium]|nr:PD40 domain-containing protein [Verrucomicrobiales bacterium]
MCPTRLFGVLFQLCALFGVSVVVLIYSPLSLGVDRKLSVQTEPTGAMVTWEVTKRGQVSLESRQTPFIEEFAVNEKNPLVLAVEKEGYFSISTNFSEAEAKALPRTQVSPFRIPLQRSDYSVTLQVTGMPPGAKVEVDDGKAEPVASRVVRLRRKSPDAPFSAVRIRVAHPDYAVLERTVGLEDLPAEIRKELDSGSATSTKVWDVAVSATEIRRATRLIVETDAKDVSVSIDGELVGATSGGEGSRFRFEKDVEFTRTPDSEFSLKRLELAKQDYEFEDPSTSVKAERLVFMISPEVPRTNFLVNRISPAPFVKVPVKCWDLQGRELHVATNELLSLVQATAPRGATEFAPRLDAQASLMFGRLCTDPDDGGVVYALALHHENGQGAQEGLVEAAIASHRSQGVSPELLFQGGQEYQATDPFVAKDGRLYFSGVRDGVRYIMVKPTRGVAVPEHFSLNNQGNYADSQPAVAPGDSRQPIIAFTRRPAQLVADNTPKIWVAEEGRLRPLGIGHSPAWDPKGLSIAFVDGFGRIAVRPGNGSLDPKPLTDRKDSASAPVWTSNGRFIVFAARRHRAGGGLRSDIAVVTLDGSSTKNLVENNSFNAFPTISPEGRYLYYISNAGAARSGQTDSVRIIRMDLEPQYHED